MGSCIRGTTRTRLFTLWIVVAWLSVTVAGSASGLGMSHLQPDNGSEPPIQLRMSSQFPMVSVGEAFDLVITLHGSRHSAEPRFELIPDGFEVSYKGGREQSSSSVVIFNGQRVTDDRSLRYVHVYEVVPHKAGRYVIPSATVVIDGTTYRSNAVEISVDQPQPHDDLLLEIDANNVAPYVGEPIRLTFTLLIRGGRSLRELDVRIENSNDRFTLDYVPVNQRVFTDGRRQPIPAFGGEVEAFQHTRAVDGERFVAFTFEMYAVPKETGVQVVRGSAVGEVILGRRGFREITDRFAIPSNEITLDVRSFPEADQPAAFNGLVGPIKIESSISPAEVNVGDPMTLTVRVFGDEPLSRFEWPGLEAMPGFSENFRMNDEPPTRTAATSVLEFTQTIRPTSENVDEVPAIEVPYFDATIEQYTVARSEPLPLTVRETRVVTSADAIGTEAQAVVGTTIEDAVGGIAHNYVDPSILIDQQFTLAEAVRSPVSLALLGAPPLSYALASLFLTMRRRREDSAPQRRRRQAGQHAIRALESLSFADGSASVEQAGHIMDTVHAFFADKFDRLAAGLTTRDCVEMARAVDPDIATRVRDILERCDAARYAGIGDSAIRQLRDDAIDAIRQLDQASGNGTSGGQAA